MSLLPLYSGVFLAALSLTWLLQKYAPRLHLLDAPISRSAHSLPTPRGGGLSICLLFESSVVYFYFSGFIPQAEFLAISGALLIALLGLLDDVLTLRMRWRLPVQFLTAIWAVYWLGGVAAIDFGLFTLTNPLILSVMGVFAMVWLLNLYHFMDGIDGLATTELLFVNVMSLFFVINSGDQLIGLLSAVLLSAGAGFLFWNWPPAKIFLGDVGSGFIGFVLGTLAIISMQSESFTVWTWFILLGVFVVDSTVTLLIRLGRRENWYEGHASHAYQNAARMYKSHAKVTIRVLVINCLWLAPLAWLSTRQPEYGVLFCGIALGPLILLALRLNAGKLMEFAN
ncbi:MAG: glycosyltransferase family 4 protein [Gammaproteobacteria bacterium]|nr:glycosyltransferase family 4 protein [Gammaproteobacteria bacterium]